MRKAFIFFCFLAVCYTAEAQSLDVFNIDASGFPVVKAKVYAFDKDGKQISNLTPSDFKITENTIDRTITKISCPPPKPFEKVSVAMSIDISGSMRSAQGTSDIPVELGKTTATNIANIFSLPPNEMALQTCHGDAFINLDFTTNRQRVLDVIKPVTAGGGNDFVEHLLNPETGILNVAKNGKYKRVAILYTDAWWYALTPDELQRCRDTCAKYNIRFYAAIYSRPEAEPNGIKKSLNELAEATGGHLYDGIISVKDAEVLANELKGAISSREPCEIEWMSGPGCSTERSVAFDLTPYNVESFGNYSAPKGSNIEIGIAPAGVIAMGEVGVGSFKDTTINISAKNSDIEIIRIIPSHSNISILDYGGSPPPFILKQDKNRVLKLRYAQTDSSFIFALLTVESNICNVQNAYISGGSRTKPPVNKTLKLTYPNGGETLQAGSDALISWSGIPSNDPVKLDYSIDNGENWIRITQNATMPQEWTIPNTVSSECLMRVQSFYSDTGKIEWSKFINTDRGDHYLAYAIEADDYGNSYVFGRFEPPGVDFGNGITLTSTLRTVNSGAVNHDVFIAKYNPEGVILWANKIISNEYNFGNSGLISTNNSLSLDKFGHIYISSYFSDSANFGPVSFQTNSKNFDTYLAKYDTSGKFIWAKNITSTGNDVPQSVTTDQKGNIYIGGITQSPTLITDNNVRLQNDGYEGGFLIKFNPDGSADWGKCMNTKYARQAVYSVAVDNDNDVIVSGSYSADYTLENGVILKANSDPNLFKAFLLKYNESGDFLWGKRANSGSGSDFVGTVQIDIFGNLHCLGYVSRSNSSVDFGRGIIFDGTKNFRFIGVFDQQGDVIKIDSIPSQYGARLSIDNEGKSIIYGQFADSISFGNNVNLFGTSEPTGYLVMYNYDGVAQWAKTLDIKKLTNVTIDCNITGSVYLCGYADQIIVSKFVLATSLNQSDTSDAVFSIVKPLATSHNIDMSRVLVTSSKDSLIQSFIENTGSWPIRIDAINIAGTHASDFQLVSGIPPFTIAVGEKKSVEFRFKPSAIGPRSADLTVVTQADTLHQSIIGEGVKPVIQVASSFIDFGVMEVGSLKDTMVTAVLKNIGDVPLAIINTAMLGPDKEQFEIISGGGSFTLASGAAQTMQLRFSPKYIGRTSGQIGFEYDDMPGGRPAVVQLFGQGIGGNVYVVDDSAYIGETRAVKLMLGKVKPASIAQTDATSFRVTLAFKNSILSPASAAFLNNSVFKKGVDTDTLTVTQQWSAQSSQLTQIPFVATLGDRLATDIELLEFAWLDDTGAKVEYDTELQSGIFTVLGICPEGGDRLFDADGEAQMMLVTPNPVNTTAEVRFKTIEKGMTAITLTDVLGRQFQLAKREYSIGDHAVEIPAGALTQGMYILTMQTPTQVFTQHVIIEK
jgi:hypothetical protein